MWLAIDLGIVGLGLILLVIMGLSAWRRWKKLSRTGGRLGTRVSSLGDLVNTTLGSLSDQLQESERLPDQHGS